MAESNIYTDLNLMHNILSTKFLGGDKTSAFIAENFLNWLIFNEESNKNTDIFSLEAKQELIKNSGIQSIINQFNLYTEQSLQWRQDLSKAKDLGDSIWRKTMGDFGKFALERGLSTESLFVDLINSFDLNNNAIRQTGVNSSTVVINKWAQSIFKNIEQFTEDEIKNLVSDSELVRYAGRSGKADTMGNGSITYKVDFINYSKELNACYKVFSNSSLKSVNDISRIHLEKVDVFKAYSAFINFAKSKKAMTRKGIRNIFNYYYDGGNGQSDPNVNIHLNHLLRVYAFSGFGTSNLGEDLSNINKGVDYLIVVDNISKHIHIKTASQIIEYLMKNRSTTLNTDVYLSLLTLVGK